MTPCLDCYYTSLDHEANRIIKRRKTTAAKLGPTAWKNVVKAAADLLETGETEDFVLCERHSAS